MQEEPRNSSLATPFRRDASITCVAIDKDLRRTDLASKPIDDHRHRVAGVIDKQLVAADVSLSHIVTDNRDAQLRYSSQKRE